MSRRSRLARVSLAALLGCALVLIAAGCGGSASTQNPEHTGGAAPGDAVKVVGPDGKSRSLTLKELDALPKGRIQVEGNWEEGPTLPDLLSAAGIKEFRQVTLLGADSAKMTLTKDQVNREVVMDFTNHGTLKFSSPAVPKKDWIKDVSTITVE